MQCDGAGQRISLHVQDCFESRAGLSPISNLMAIEFAQVAERSWICRVHAVCLRVEFFRQPITSCQFCPQATSHDLFYPRAFTRLEYRCCCHAANNVDAEFLEFLCRFL